MTINRLKRHPRLALWAGAGVLLLAATLLVSCDDAAVEKKGPLGPPDANDPYPVWLYYNKHIEKFDRNGNSLLTIHTEYAVYGFEVNHANGDLWTYESGGENAVTRAVKIYTNEGKVKKTIATPWAWAVDFAIDTNADVVWGLVQPKDESDDIYLDKYDYDGAFISRVTVTGLFDVTSAIRVYEKTGDLWVLGVKYDVNEPNSLAKFDRNGELIFKRTHDEMGLPAADYCEVDQTDGTAWVGYGGGAVKIAADGGVTKKDNDIHYVSCINRRNGDYVAAHLDEKDWYLRMYRRTGALKWEIWGAKYSTSWGWAAGFAAISEEDGNIWYLRHLEPGKYALEKLDANGETLSEVTRAGGAYNLAIRGNVYPY